MASKRGYIADPNGSITIVPCTEFAGHYFFQGDIGIGPAEHHAEVINLLDTAGLKGASIHLDKLDGKLRSLIRRVKPWTNYEVYYRIDSGAMDGWGVAIENAIEIWQSVVPLRFIKIEETADNYITIEEKADLDPLLGYSTSLGMGSGEQWIWLNPEAKNEVRVFTITHELGHALGLVHHFSRTDRDRYLDASSETGFGILEYAPQFYSIGAFDYRSVMQYYFEYDRIPKFGPGKDVIENDYAGTPAAVDAAGILALYEGNLSSCVLQSEYAFDPDFDFILGVGGKELRVNTDKLKPGKELLRRGHPDGDPEDPTIEFSIYDAMDALPYIRIADDGPYLLDGLTLKMGVQDAGENTTKWIRQFSIPRDGQTLGANSGKRRYFKQEASLPAARHAWERPRGQTGNASGERYRLTDWLDVQIKSLEVRLKTGVRGTDGDVWLGLFGTEIRLDTEGSNFERDQEDVFRFGEDSNVPHDVDLKIFTVADLIHNEAYIRIGKSNRYGWSFRSAVVTARICKTDGDQYTFEFKRELPETPLDWTYYGNIIHLQMITNAPETFKINP